MQLTKIKWIPMALVITAGATLNHSYADTAPLTSIKVTQGNDNGWEVTAVGEVTIQSPAGKKTVLSQPFKTKNTDWTPSGPIRCEWSANGIVAIFSDHPRVTDIYVFDTKSQKRLKETFGKKKMPTWYDNVATVHDFAEGRWNGNRLGISSKVILRNQEQHAKKQTLEISGQTFTLKTSSSNPSP